MKIGVISDVHDHIDHLNQALDVFKKLAVETVFFCGDLVSPFTLKWLKEWPFPVKAVFGNNEGDWWGITRRLEVYGVTNIEFQKAGNTWTGALEGKKCCLYHGQDPALTDALIRVGQYDLVCTGHTHEPHIETVNQTLWVNPGSIAGISENPAITQPSLAIVNTDPLSAQIITF